MALTDVNGYPLKWELHIDTTKAEADYKAMLKRMEDGGSKASISLQKVVKENSMPASKTIFLPTSLRTGFDALTGSMQSVHKAIAKTKSETQSLAQAERDLRKALKDNLISEDQYIKKLALISARRTELNDKLREYRVQLKAVEVEKTKAKPYTSADTALEIQATKSGQTGTITSGTVTNPADVERATVANANYASSISKTNTELKKQVVASTEVKVATDSQMVSLTALKQELADYRIKAAQATDPEKLKLYNSEIQTLEGQIGKMSNVGKTGFDNVGNAIEKNVKKTNAFTSAVSKSWSVLRMAAYIIPGLGIAGLMSLLIDPIMKVINRLGILKKSIADTFTGSEYKDGIKNVKQLKEDIDLAKNGVISKDKVVKEYNKTIGKTAGELKNFGDVEKWIEEKSSAYIKAIKMRAEAQALLTLSIDQITEAQKRAFEGPSTSQKAIAALGSVFQSGGLDQYRTNLNQLLNEELSGLATTSERAEKAWESMLAKSEAFNKENGFNFDDKEIAKKPKAEKDTLLQQLEESLSRQATAFEKFEQFKTSVNETEAKKRFANEIGEFKTFSEYVQSEFDGLFSEAGTDDWKKFNESQKARYDAILKATQTFNNNQRDNNNQAYIEAFEASKTHADKLEDIEAEYYRNVAALGESATMEQLRVLDEQKEEALRAANDEAFLKTEIYKKSAEEALVLTRNQLKEQIKIIKELLSDGSITGTIKENLEKELSFLKINLDLGAKSFNLKNLESEANNIKEAIDKYLEINNIDFPGIVEQRAHPELKKLIDKLKEVGATINEVNKTADDGGKGLSGFLARLTDNEGLKKFTEWGDMAAQSFGEMSNALGGVETEAGAALETMGELVGVAADLGKALLSNNPVQIVGTIVKGISSIFSISKRSKEMAAQSRQSIADFYATALKGEKEYQDLLDQRAIENVKNNSVRLQAIKEEIALRKKQADLDNIEFNETMRKVSGKEYISGQKTEKYGGILGIGKKTRVVNVMGSLRGKDFEELNSLLSQGKLEGEAKALVERLVELEKQGYDASLAMEALAKETAEIFTGTTASNLTDSLANMFKEGKTGAQDFADFFESTMQDAAMSIFKNKVLAEMMSNFYESFAEAAKSGDELTASEIESLRAKWIADTETANKKWNQMTEVTGLPDNSNSNQSGLRGAIASPCTEESMSRMESKTIKINIICQH